MIRVSLTLLLVATTAVAADSPKPVNLPVSIISAYKKLGGEYGHLELSDFGFLKSKYLVSRARLAPDAVPIFRFEKFPSVPLPPVETPFGLDLTRTLLTDANLANLATVQNLTALVFADSQLSDAGLAHVAKFSKLTTLDLSRTPITDAGLQHLAKMSSLKTLLLDGTNVTDKGLIQVAKLDSLKMLQTGPKKLTDEVVIGLIEAGRLHVLAQVRAMKGRADSDRDISHLLIPKTAVTDKALPHVAKLTTLTGFTANDTAITDAGLMHLSKLSNLALLNVMNTKVTAAGEAKFRKAVPRCTVLR